MDNSEQIIQELLDALRELHDFACMDVDYRYEKRSKEAFDNAAKLLNRLEPQTEGLKIDESR